MKKFLSFILIAIMCVLPLTACSTDFSATIEGKMDELYESVKEVAEPFLKQDEKYNTNTSSENESTDEITSGEESE